MTKRWIEPHTDMFRSAAAFGYDSDLAEDLEEDTDESIKARRAQDCLSCLDGRERLVVEMKLGFNGVRMTDQEIADATGWPRRTVNWIYNCAIGKMKGEGRG